MITVLLMACVLVVGLAMSVDWAIPGKWLQRYITERIIQAPNGAVAVPYPREAYAYVRARDWKNALEAAKLSIQTQPTGTEGYHIAGLAAGQIYGVHSNESRAYYAKYVELEPDTRKTAFVKEIFPDLIKSTHDPLPPRAPSSNYSSRIAILKWLVVGFILWYRNNARRKRQANQTKVDQPKNI